MRNIRTVEGWRSDVTNPDTPCKRARIINYTMLNASRYGVTSGAEAFATSVASGMEGVFVSQALAILNTSLAHMNQMKPIEGAESEGATGFFKGIGKGLVGYVSLFGSFSLD